MSKERYRIIAELVSDFSYEFSVLPDGTLKLEWMDGPLIDEIDFDVEDAGIGAWMQLLHSDDLPLAMGRLPVVLTGKLGPGEYRVIDKKGETRWLRIYTHPIWDESRESVVGLVGAAQDITETKQSEIALRESEEKYRATLDAMGDAIHVVDAEMNLILCNEAASQAISSLGLETDILGRCLYDVVPFLSKRHRDEYRQIFQNGEVLVTEEYLDFKGQERFTETRKIPILEDDAVAEVVTVVRDTTEHTRAERALQQSEERLRLLLENTEDIIFLQDRDGNYLYYNGPKRYGLTADDVIGHKPSDFWPPDIAQTMVDRIQTVFDTGEPIKLENQVVWQGTPLWFIDYIYPVRNADGEIIAVGVISRNITERKQAEEALRQSEEQYRQLIENLQEGICLLDRDDRIAFVNQRLAEMLGYTVDELKGRHPFDLMDADQEAIVQRALKNRRQGVKEQYDLEFQRKDGTPLFAYLVATPIIEDGVYAGALAGIVDISERRQMEAQLKEYADHLERMVDKKVRELDEERAKVIHAGRLAALGELATSVAHELRQPLAAMQIEADCLGLVADKASHGILDPEQLELAALDQVSGNLTHEIERCERIIDHLRIFGRISKSELAAVDLNRPIQDSFILIDERLRQHGVQVELQLAPDLPPILGNSTRLEQVFINLISNAAHAMEKMSHRVMLGEVQRDQYKRRLEIATFVEDGNVVATVRDNGCGISEEDQEHIFKSFFTTKPLGEGTGLGLSISKGIVEEHKGDISFETEENKGTIFIVKFPILGRDRE